MQTTDSSLFRLLQTLELELHQPATRSDVKRLDALLHEDFCEFGRSGMTHTKADILSRLPAQATAPAIATDRFEMRRLGEFAALITYRSAQYLPNGTLDDFALRSSVWLHSAQGWQMSFHQGTPATRFEPFKPRQ